MYKTFIDLESAARHLNTTVKHIQELVMNRRIKATPDGSEVDLSDLVSYKRAYEDHIPIHDVSFTSQITPEQSMEIIRRNLNDSYFSPSALGLLAVLHVAAHATAEQVPHPTIQAERRDLKELLMLKFLRTEQTGLHMRVVLTRLKFVQMT